MDSLIQFLVVFGLGVIELWVAIPTGFVLGLDPVAIALASSFGAIVGVVISFLMVKQVLTWAVEKFGLDIVGFIQRRRIYRIWEKHGVIGLGLLAPLLTGAALGIGIGLVLGVPKKTLLLWMIIGVLLWSVALTLAIVLGIITVESLLN